MTLILIEFAIVLIGFAMTCILFHRIPTLPAPDNNTCESLCVSVIIPVRNEEYNLPKLLKDLSVQTVPVAEIICVDDASVDSTARIALENGARLISLDNKEKGWTGKSWACQNGANEAKGELLLFLDADVRLGPDGIKTILSAYMKERTTISVQPYHNTVKLYEQLSVMFNLVQIAANGSALRKQKNIGLYGPVILISQKDYQKAGGHESVKSSIVDDMALGQQLKKAGIRFKVFVGNSQVSFRMYAGGLRSLLQGWVKNMASGAEKTSAPVFIATFFWVTSLLSVPLQIVKFTFSANHLWLAIYWVIYIIWVFLLTKLTKWVGHFKICALIFFPVPVYVFLGVITVSAFKKLFGLGVNWKGRKIKTGD